MKERKVRRQGRRILLLVLDINFCKIEFDYYVVGLPCRGKYHEERKVRMQGNTSSDT